MNDEEMKKKKNYSTTCRGVEPAAGANVKPSFFFLDTRRPTCRITSPALTALNSAIASAWVIPCRGLEFIDSISSPGKTSNLNFVNYVNFTKVFGAIVFFSIHIFHYACDWFIF